MHTGLHRLAVAAAIVAFIVIVLGAYVRLSHAGLGCPDWPGCYGQLTWPVEAAEVSEANLAFPDRPFYQEFAVDGPLPAEEVIARLRKRKILPGVALSRWFADQPNRLLVAVTEVKTKKQIDALVRALGALKAGG